MVGRRDTQEMRKNWLKEFYELTKEHSETVILSAGRYMYGSGKTPKAAAELFMQQIIAEKFDI